MVTCHFLDKRIRGNGLFRNSLLGVRIQRTLLKTDFIREGCLACQNRNPRTIRWKASFKGLRIYVCIGVSSDSLFTVIESPNCPAEFSNETPLTCCGSAAAATSAVNPPRLKDQHSYVKKEIYPFSTSNKSVR